MKEFDRVKAGLKGFAIHHLGAGPSSNQPGSLRKLWAPYGDPEYDWGIELENDNKAAIFQGRKLQYQGAHAVGESEKPDFFKEPIYWSNKWHCYLSTWPNQHLIGLCFGWDASLKPVPDVIINEMAYLIKKIAPRYKIEISRKTVIPHYKISSTFCPGEHTMDMLWKKLSI